MSDFRRPLFITILLAYLVAGLLYAVLTPAWQAPDEPAHYNYIRYLATAWHFPELVSQCYNQAYLEQLTSRRFPPDLPVDNVCYEFHQPPLYYLLATPVFLLSAGSLLALRCLSLVLGGGVVALAFFIGRTICPERSAIAYGTMAWVAGVPMHVAMLASVNNDVLAELILAGLLFLLCRRLLHLEQPSAQANLRLGVLLGLGLLTKVTVYIGIPLVAAVLWEEARRRGGEEAKRRRGEEAKRRGGEEAKERGSEETGLGENRVKAGWLDKAGGWRGLAGQAALIYGVALALALPWYLRNGRVYGQFDILGLVRHDQVVVGQLRTADFVAEVGWAAYIHSLVTTTFHSFWGQFGWMAAPMDGRVYLALILLSLTALGGLVGFGIYLGFGIKDLGYGGGDLGYERGVFKSLGHSTNNENVIASGAKQSPRRSWRLLRSLRSLAVTYAVLRQGNRSSEQRGALGLLALAVSLTVIGYAWYNMEFVQFQGRYLFPALIPLGLFFSIGLSQALQRRWAGWLAGGFTVALLWVIAASLLTGNLDKWAVLVTGLPFGLATGRALLAQRWPVPANWLLAACYGGLSLLTLVSPFWFVLPYLSR